MDKANETEDPAAAGKADRGSRRRILVYMPEAQEAARLEKMLAQENAEAVLCAGTADLQSHAAEGADALLVHEQLFSEEVIGSLAEGLRGQEAWSEVPIFLVAADQGENDVAVKASAWGNVLVLEHPVGAAAMNSALQVARRIRDKEVVIRKFLEKIRQDQEALRRSEERYRGLSDDLKLRNAELEIERARWRGVVEGIADEVWVCDQQEKMSLINLPEVTAMGLEAFRNRPIAEVLQEVDIFRLDGTPRPADEAPLLRSLRTGKIVRGEEIMRHRRTGKSRYRQFSCAPMRDAATGAITGAVAIVRDITAHKLAEQALHASEERFAAFMRHLPGAAWIKDPAGRYVYANPEAERIFSTPWSMLRGKTDEDIFPPETARQFRDNDRRVLVEGGAVRTIEVLRQADGLDHHSMVSKFAVAGPDGQAAYIGGVAFDITDIIRAEEALRQLNLKLESRVLERTSELSETVARLNVEATERTEAERRLRASNEELQRMTTQLRAMAQEMTGAEERERRKLAQVLHDHLQPLLVGTRLKLEAVGNLVTQRTLKAHIIEAHSSLEEAIRESRSLAVQLAPPVLKEKGFAAAVAWITQHVTERYGLRVKLKVGQAREVEDEIVQGLLFQFVREMLLNVIKHAGVRAASVTISCPKPGLLRIEVADKGRGFDPGSREKEEGSHGFGLHNLKQRVQLLGGQMILASAPGKGTRVTLTVPATASGPDFGRVPMVEAVKMRIEEAPPPKQTPSVKRVGAKVRVLLADDHQIVRDGLVELVNQQPELEVVGEAGDGDAAVELSRRLRPDVIVMDINMPGRSGIEATRLITRDLPGTHVIGFSIHEDRVLAGAMLRAGAAVCLSKAAGNGHLVLALKRYLRKKQRELEASQDKTTG